MSANAQQIPGGFLVKGTHASKYEYNLASALDFYNLEFHFQVDFFGGRMLPGGYIVDFMIYAPFEKPAETMGDYWHEGQLGMRDKLRFKILESFLGQKITKLWAPEVGTYEAALSSVRRYFIT